MRYRQIRAHGINRHLQPNAERLAHGVDQPRAAARPGLQADDHVVQPAPAGAYVPHHAHGTHNAGVARGRPRERGRVRVEPRGVFKPPAGQTLGGKTENEHQYPARHGHHAQHGVQNENQDKIDGHPRHVEKRKHRIAAQKVPQNLDIPETALILPPRA